MCNKTRKETSGNRHESRLTFFENRPIIKETAINTLLIFAFSGELERAGDPAEFRGKPLFLSPEKRCRKGGGYNG